MVNSTYTAQPLGAVAVPLVRSRRCDRCGGALAAQRRVNASGLYLCADCRPYRNDYLRRGQTWRRTR